MTGGEAANGGAERVLWPGDLEGARHDGLHVAVSVVAQSLKDALARDDTDQLRTAHHRKIKNIAITNRTRT